LSLEHEFSWSEVQVPDWIIVITNIVVGKLNFKSVSDGSLNIAEYDGILGFFQSSTNSLALSKVHIDLVVFHLPKGCVCIKSFQVFGNGL